MYRCKHARHNAVHKHTKSKILISLLAMALVCCVSVSGTLAWIMRQTDPVVNTFTYGDIHITLEETGIACDDSHRTNQYAMAPQAGFAIAKDPTVTVKAASEDCWLFVTLDESDNFGEYLTYDTEAGWHPLPQQSTTGGAYVYYRAVDYSHADQAFAVIADNTVYVKHGVTKEKLDILDDDTYPTLTVNAYAVQRAGIGDSDATQREQAQEAWELIFDEFYD